MTSSSYGAVPEISRFFGIVIQMYPGDHHPPHFHARHAGRSARIAIGTHEILAGSLQPKALALVIEWAAIHADELWADWELARLRKPLSKIDPLR